MAAMGRIDSYARNVTLDRTQPECTNSKRVCCATKRISRRIGVVTKKNNRFTRYGYEPGSRSDDTGCCAIAHPEVEGMGAE